MDKTQPPPVYTPFPGPGASNDMRPAPLSGVQEEKRLQIISHFSTDNYTLPGIETNGALMEVEKFWLTSDCILRYLRATKWDPKESIIRLEGTLKWRREFGLYDRITSDYVKPEGVTGLAVALGYDTSSRPNVYLFPSQQITEPTMRQVEYAFFVLEQSLELTGPGVEDIVVLVNFGDRAGRIPSLSLSRTALQILQMHYPERLGRVFVGNVPWLFVAFMKIVMTFLDPVTREKVQFNPDIVGAGFIDANQLMARDDWGGSINFIYEQEKYWPAFLDMAGARREANMARWRALGGKVGLDEWAIKGGPTATTSTGHVGSEKLGPQTSKTDIPMEVV